MMNGENKDPVLKISGLSALIAAFDYRGAVKEMGRRIVAPPSNDAISTSRRFPGPSSLPEFRALSL